MTLKKYAQTVYIPEKIWYNTNECSFYKIDTPSVAKASFDSSFYAKKSFGGEIENGTSTISIKIPFFADGGSTASD